MLSDRQTESTIGKIIDCRSRRYLTFTYEVDNKVYVKTIMRGMKDSYSMNQLLKVFYDPSNPKNASFVSL